MDYDPKLLTTLGRRRQMLHGSLEELRPLLADAIRAAAEAGVSQVEIVRLTGYTRDQVRQICLPADRRRSRARAS